MATVMERAAKISSDHRHCCVPGCTNDGRRNPKKTLSFFHFPKEKTLRKRWLVKIRRDEGTYFKISEKTVVCSAHFLPSQFNRSLLGLRRYLKKDAVPTVFSFSVTVSPKHGKARKSPRKRCAFPEAAVSASADEDGPAAAQPDREIRVHPHPDHDYAVHTASTQEQLEAARTHIDVVEGCLEKERSTHFCLGRFAGSDAKIKKYTGFESYKLFKAVFEVIQPTAQTMIRWGQVCRHKGTVQNCKPDAFRNETLPLVDQFFLFLCRIRVGFDEESLSDMFRVSQSTVSRTLITWVNYLYALLGATTVWPSRKTVQENMPDCFKKSYPKTRVILDCTEVKVQTPSSKVLNSMTYSSYKSHATYKCLIGISPDGCVVFVSNLFTGNISDKEITKRSGLIGLLEEGDEVMADKGFIIQDLLVSKKATLVIPPFLRHDDQFSLSQVLLTQEIARLRVHVERAIRRVKEYKILQQVIPLTLAGSFSQLMTVCALLTNFRGRLF